MEEYKVNNILDLHKIFAARKSHSGISWWFRGQSNIEWNLLPKAGRKEFRLPNDRDLGRFNFWKDQAIGYDSNLPENDWEALAIAQHFGLATRLLDWTHNPMVATFFAVHENYDKDGVIYGYHPELFIDHIKTPLNYKCNGFGFIPRILSNRILNQKSLFTVHGPVDAKIIEKPSEFLKDMINIFKIIIPKDVKEEIQKHISDYGFTYVNLFPDLDGLSKHINWDTKGIVKFKNKKKV